MSVEHNMLYIKGDQSVEVQAKEITLGDVITMECVNPSVVAKLKTIKLVKVQNPKKHRFVISILKVIEKIHEEYPNLQIQNMGAVDIIVTYEPVKQKNLFLYWAKVVVVIAITFFGAAFSIMAFNNDVDVAKLFEQIYKQVTGAPKTGFTVLELTYSLGVIIGILVFFNHFGKKRFSVDPTPMEVEMRLYENDIQTTIIENYSREGQELDVDTGSTFGNHRT